MNNDLQHEHMEAEIILGDILKAALDIAFQRGVPENRVLRQLEWAQVTAFQDHYERRKKEEEGH